MTDDVRRPGHITLIFALAGTLLLSSCRLYESTDIDVDGNATTDTRPGPDSAVDSGPASDTSADDTRPPSDTTGPRDTAAEDTGAEDTRPEDTTPGDTDTHDAADTAGDIDTGSDTDACVTTETDEKSFDGVDNDCDGLVDEVVKDFDVGDKRACAILLDDTVECWGGKLDAKIDMTPTSKKFSDIAVGNRTACGILKSSDEIHCWGDDQFGGVSGAPSGKFEFIEASSNQTCAAPLSGTKVECWGVSGSGPDPGTDINALLLDSSSVCWLDNTNLFECDEMDSLRSMAPAPKIFDDLDLTGSGACGVKPDGSLACWDDGGMMTNPFGRLDPPSGTNFEQVALGTDTGCARQSNGQVTCWSSSSRTFAQTDPTGTFEDIALTSGTLCGRKADNTIDCWELCGNNDGQSTICSR